jgi:dihydroorotate dehydrogenase (fumarate)
MDLTTRYLGLTLKSPLVASASPLTLDVGNIRALEDHGAGAVVLPSIFEEQIEQEAEQADLYTTAGADSFAEALSYFPPAENYHMGTGPYLETIRAARAAVDIPIIASLNGSTNHGWVNYAREIEQAGASALELNVFFIPADPHLMGAMVEHRYRNIMHAVRSTVSIPVAMKLSPYFSATGAMIRELDAAGTDGFVLFNRFYQPDIDLSTLRLLRDLQLSTSAEIRLPLLWIGLLSGQIRASLAATTGVETEEQVIKYLLVGADVVMTTSALLRHGVAHMRTLLNGLTAWLDARGARLDDIRGRMSQRRIRDPGAFERMNYIRILQGFAGR